MFKKLLLSLSAAGLLFGIASANAVPSGQPYQFAAGANYTLCFVPDGASCEDLLVDSINSTSKSLLIQAY